jgi:acetolactate synthase-1/2/3 large subunit
MTTGLKPTNVVSTADAGLSVGLSAPSTVAEGLAEALRTLGVVNAFGVCGGAQALLWAAFSRRLDLLHFRHESGAAFAATEAHFASGQPVVVFTTTGPGITNVLTGILAARTEGAKIILISAYASAAQRGRGGIQETSSYTMPTSALFEHGAWFDDASVLDTPDQLPQVLRRFAAGLRRPDGYVAHLSIPNAVQGAPLSGPLPVLTSEATGLSVATYRPSVNPTAIARCAELLSAAPFAIWAGFGSRGAPRGLRELAERTSAPVMCSPRAKGVFPEDHPLFIGVTGMGGHTAMAANYMREHAPRRVLVLGSRLGEPTSFWNPVFIPPDGFIHVDVNPAVPGLAYPQADTLAVQGDVGDFLAALLEAWPTSRVATTAPRLPRPHPVHPEPNGSGRVRPSVLMSIIQRTIVDGSNAIVLAESGNSFTWATHYLRFNQPKRYRVSTNVGSMGHAAAGVLGAAIGHGRAVAIVGDGAMHMNIELNTAAKRGVPAIWIILNDGRYNMCHQGMTALGMTGVADAAFPMTDFALLAQSLGAQGVRVEHEAELEAAITQALSASGPFVVDVLIDADEVAPTHGRNEGLRATGGLARVKELSFPVNAAH